MVHRCRGRAGLEVHLGGALDPLLHGIGDLPAWALTAAVPTRRSLRSRPTRSSGSAAPPPPGTNRSSPSTGSSALEREVRDILGWQASGGFNVDASVRVGVDDRAAVERLVRRCARGPLALERRLPRPGAQPPRHLHGAQAVRGPRRLLHRPGHGGVHGPSPGRRHYLTLSDTDTVVAGLFLADVGKRIEDGDRGRRAPPERPRQGAAPLVTAAAALERGVPTKCAT
jgi:hypothetical protein